MWEKRYNFNWHLAKLLRREQQKQKTMYDAEDDGWSRRWWMKQKVN